MMQMNMSHVMGTGFSVALWLMFFCTLSQGNALTCDHNMFACASGDKCITNLWKCDGEHDCVDGSDEANCGSMNPSCSKTQFQCTTGRCLHMNWRCDGERDCTDGSDEANCEKPREKCAAEMIRCDNGRCLSPVYVCDGDDDCGDRSDEKNCSRTCSSLHFQCAIDDRCILNTWRCDGDRDCADGTDEKNCSSATTKNCQKGYFKCGNGRCIPSNFLCDGDKDCIDGSDERNCGKTTCPSKSFTCGDGKCIMPGWRCDGENDCIDGMDERNCTRNKSCPKNHFLCKTVSNNTHLCIKKQLVCNGVMDCFDASDEDNCSMPNKTIDCISYDSNGCNRENCTTTTKKCGSCYALWRYEFGEKKVLSQGCWSKCSSGDKCIEHSKSKPYRKTLKFCCCTGSNCNDIKNTTQAKCPEYRCKDGTCVSANSRCDGKLDCPNGDDEDSCEKECLMNLGIKSVSSPQDSTSLKPLKSFNVFLNNSRSAWCSRKSKGRQWITIDLGMVRSVQALTTLGYPVGTEPSFANFTLQLGRETEVFLNFTENGKTKVFFGNENPLIQVKHVLPRLVKARYIKILPKAFGEKNFACLRVAILGCSKSIIPETTINQRVVTPDIGQDGSAYCTVRSQRDYNSTVRWLMKGKSGSFEPLTSGHNHIIEEKQLKLETKFDLFMERQVHLRYQYNFDYIKEMFNCQHNRINDTFICSSEYKCIAEYLPLESGPHSFSKVSIKYHFGKRVKMVKLKVRNVTDSGVTAEWDVHPKPNYQLSVKSILWLRKMLDGGGKPLIVKLDSTPFQLKSLAPYRQYRLQLHIPPMVLPGIKNTIRSNLVIFTTLVKNPGAPLSRLTAVHIGSNFAVIHCKPPAREKCNGPIDGFVLRKKRIANGGTTVNEKSTEIIVTGKEIVKIDDLKPLSTYNITVTAFNLLNGVKLESEAKRITFNTLNEKPTLTPNRVEAIFEPTRWINIKWDVPTDAPIVILMGFQIRVHEITKQSMRKRREANTNTKIFKVDKTRRNEKIVVSPNSEFCMVQVAMYSGAGVGPFSQPITVKIEKLKPTTQVTTETEKKKTTKKTKAIKVTSKSVVTTAWVSSQMTKSKPNKVGSKDTAKMKEEKRHFFTEFIVAIVVAVCLLIIVIIAAFKTHQYRKKANWNNKGYNGYNCEGRKMEPFLLDDEGENWNSEGVSTDSLEYAKDKTDLSSL